MKDHIFRILLLIVLAAAGFIMVPITVHLLILSGLLDSETAPQGFLTEMITKSTYVWIGAVIAGIVSLFINQGWRLYLLLCPLILPALFTIIYTFAQA